jgi:1,2-beta-oligoglucan phosphorylase
MILTNSCSFTIEFLDNGCIKTIDAASVRISLKPQSPFSRSGANIFLRKRGESIIYKPLLGPESSSSFMFSKDALVVTDNWEGIEYRAILSLSEKSLSWQFSTEIRNTTQNPVDLDLVYVQDVGLKPLNAGLINEYYVSQYLERRILENKTYGAVVCCRQNMKESVGNPWIMLACKNGASSACTDGMLFYGKTFRETGVPERLLADNLGREYAGESPVVALQEKPFRLAPGESHQSVFVGTCLLDHPQATSPEDLKRLPALFDEFKNELLNVHWGEKVSPLTNLFNTTPFLPSEDFSEEEIDRFFGKERRFCETENDRLLSFFCDKHNHIILKDKELLVDRPHGHIMQANVSLTPNESIMSTTAFAFGVFNSHITQGNTNFNVLLSICRSQFNADPETGQRIFIERGGKSYLLGVPSAFEMGLNHCRWIYKHEGTIFQVRSWTSKTNPQINLDFKVISGEKVKLKTTCDFDPLNEWKISVGKKPREFIAKPKHGSMMQSKFKDARFRIVVQGDTDFKHGGDELLYNDGKNHGSPLFVMVVAETIEFAMSFIGEVVSVADVVDIDDADRQFHSEYQTANTDWKNLSLNLELKGPGDDIPAINEILPWYGMNALTHFLTPYGLEQFGGAAWGTRDVSQGPVELLLTLEKYEEARKVLLTIFSNQNSDGGWPQWWMFDSYHTIRAHEAHGDIFYWCIIALANYIIVTGDLKILEVALPYYHEKGVDFAEKAPLSEHVDRLIRMITGSFIPGTSLVPFGGGDWNDSLQPVSKELAQHLISSWTVEMNFQAFFEYQKVFEHTTSTAKSLELNTICEKIKSDFNKYLVKDGIVAGYGLLEAGGNISVLLHPDDKITGIRYSLLPMERGILSGIFTKEQAAFHQELIEKHLKGPDGARLMDRPLKYKGGIQEIFQRAESSTFFGREIGLMYVHEHIRYAELLAITGRADDFVKALRQAIPVGYREVVPGGDIRQANCYYSSSDVHFKNRYEADELYEEIKTGSITLRGGWRVYSSGPGIYIGLIVSRLLGIRVNAENVVFDPVMPGSMNGLSVSLDFFGYSIKLEYTVHDDNHSPKSILVNGKESQLIYEENEYRKGGALIPKDQFIALLNNQENLVEIKM